ncbi:hypothetical protein CFBP6109_02833 [Pseudomonas syringae pv. cerasicola]|nr:hypothetical protein CFBP6109_02833 [Pseudomonas syringae pv. cerasicola]SPF14994.1 hypothetical protein PSCFBP6110_02496 [Pseudomonas syringae pv. cerasicola]
MHFVALLNARIGKHILVYCRVSQVTTPAMNLCVVLTREVPDVFTAPVQAR